MPESALILAISQQLHNFFQNHLAHIFYLCKQTLWWSFHWILYELILKSLPQLAFIFKGQVHPNKKLIWIEREKSNKHNTENFIKIGCKIRKLWYFKVSLYFTKQLYAHPGRYANEGTDDITHSLFLLYFIIWNMIYFNFLLIVMRNKVLFLPEHVELPLF